MQQLKAFFSAVDTKLSLILVLAGVLIGAGGYLGFVSMPTGTGVVPGILTQEKPLSVFYLKKDGIYKQSSDTQAEEKIADVAAASVKQIQQTAGYGVLGSTGTAVVFPNIDAVVYPNTTTPYLTGMVMVDVATKTERVLETFPGEDKRVFFTGLAVSPDKSKVALMVTMHEGEEYSASSKRETILYIWNESGEVVNKITSQRVGSGVEFTRGVRRWIDNDTVLLSEAYEGSTFCTVSIEATALPETCSGAGGFGYGGGEEFVGLVAGKEVWYSRFDDASYAEMVGGTAPQSGVYTKTPGDDGSKEYVFTGKVVDAVLLGEEVHVLLTKNTVLYPLDNLDVLVLNLTDGSTIPITSTAQKTEVKAGMSVSSSQRFVAFSQHFLTDVIIDKPETFVAKSSVWVADKTLDVIYKVASEALLPVVVQE